MSYGLPQGACLSPTLYNVYTYDIPTINDCHLALFADDTALYTSHRLAGRITKSLENGIKKLHNYYKKWKIKLNETKTQVKFFTRRRTRQLPRRNFRINNNEIEWESGPVKYLGIQLDKTLTYKNHTDYVVKKSYAALRILYSLFNRKSHLHINSKILLYKTMIRPIVTYAAPILSSMARTHRNKMQIMQNKIIKMILNVPWRTSTVAIHQQTNIKMIEEYCNKLTDNFETRYLIS